MTSAEFAILTLIIERPRHGYEIEQVIEERGMREWTEVGFSSIYYLLKKLEKNGLITGRTEAADGKGPARKVYRPTPSGIEACQQATIQALASMHRSYPPLLLGIANLNQVPRADVLDALSRHCHELNERLVHLQIKITNQQPLPDEVATMFDYSLTMVEAEMKWIERFIRQLENKVDVKSQPQVKE